MSVESSHLLCVESTHPSLPGHFPGTPVVPGVVLLSEILAELQREHPTLQVAGIKKLKFMRMVFPEQQFIVEFAPPAATSLRFKCWQAGEVVAEGNLALLQSAQDAGRV